MQRRASALQIAGCFPIAMFLNPHHLFYGETLKNKRVGTIVYFPVPTQFPAFFTMHCMGNLFFDICDVVVYQSSRGRHRSKGGSELSDQARSFPLYIRKSDQIGSIKVGTGEHHFSHLVGLPFTKPVGTGTVRKGAVRATRSTPKLSKLARSFPFYI